MSGIQQIPLFRSYIFQRGFSNRRYYASSRKHPFKRTVDTLWNDLPSFTGKPSKPVYPEHADVVIIGGGIIGSSVAYWLKTRTARGLNVVVLEKDLTYKKAKQNMITGVLSQHFSLPENMLLSLNSAEFLRKVKENISNDVNIKFYPNGFLVVACEKYAEKLEENVAIQREYGIKNELMTPETIRKKYPWINTDDIKLGCIGTESEGIFSPVNLLNGFVTKSAELGAIYIEAEVTGFDLQAQKDVLMEGIPAGSFRRISSVKYTTPENEEYEIRFAACVLAAGGDSGEVARLADIGVGEGLLSIPLPIVNRKNNVYTLESLDFPMNVNSPVLMDTSGMWLQSHYLKKDVLCGNLPLSGVDAEKDDYFQEIIQPPLANRIPTLKDAKIINSTTVCHDYNTFDETGILGPHPYHNNLYIASGFGELGYLHAPGIGRAMAELIIDSRYMTIDFTRFGFDRILTNERMVEFNVY